MVFGSRKMEVGNAALQVCVTLEVNLVSHSLTLLICTTGIIFSLRNNKIR